MQPFPGVITSLQTQGAKYRFSGFTQTNKQTNKGNTEHGTHVLSVESCGNREQGTGNKSDASEASGVNLILRRQPQIIFLSLASQRDSSRQKIRTILGVSVSQKYFVGGSHSLPETRGGGESLREQGTGNREQGTSRVP